MIVQIGLLAVGLILLVKGADWMVVGSSALARKYHISDLAIGLTIVAFGTSAPELIVNGFASYQGHAGIVFGNVIGSNNFNLLVTLGIVGLVVPLAVQSSTVWKEIPFSMLAVLLMYVLGNDFLSTESNIMSRLDGLLLTILFGLFLFYVYKQLKSDPAEATRSSDQKMPTMRIVVLIVVGLSCLILGGRLVVSNAIAMAHALEVSEKIIGLTIVAAGTSLPELATSIVAALKKNADIAVGNIIGSNIFNIFFILAVSAMIRPVEFNPAFNNDIYLLAAATVFLFIAMFTGKKKKLDRWEAGILLTGYVIYTVFLIAAEVR